MRNITSAYHVMHLKKSVLDRVRTHETLKVYMIRKLEEFHAFIRDQVVLDNIFLSMMTLNINSVNL